MAKVIINEEQKKAIEYGNKPLLIIAGAGTGKTTVITERIKYLILEKKVKPEEILALTFTEKAATEMEERVDRIMPYGYTQMWISTFHSFCDAFLREEGLNIGLTPNYKLMSESDSIVFLRKHLFKLNLDYYRPLGNPTKFLEAMLIHFSRLRDEDITPEEYLAYADSLLQELKDTKTSPERIEEIQKTQELAHAFSQYETMKVSEGKMDFANLISSTLKLLRMRKHILKKYQEQFKHILVDEFQDTNYAQNALAILLAGERKNITVVADDDQAIYRWRGAALSNVIQFKNNFPGAEIITLTKNYRSTQEILNQSHTLIQNNNPNRLEALEHISKKLISQRKLKGKPIEFILENRVDEEAEAIAKKIQELVGKKKYEYGDIAILVRANNHAQPITHALSRFRIPYQYLGPGYLFHQEEIKDLIAYLKVLYNLEDNISLFRILNMEVFGLSVRDVSTLLTYCKKKNLSLFETLEKVEETYLSPESKEKVKRVVEMILRHLERTRRDTAGQILYYFLHDTKLFDSFLTFKTPHEEQRAQNVAKFFDKIKTFETLNREADLYSVVEWIDLMMEMGDSPIVSDIETRDLNAVNILTIHSSKGLEFPVVFLINLVSDRFPTRERHEKLPVDPHLIKEIVPEGDYHLQEERRLFYVGMTRARDLLFLTAAKFYAEGKREKKISPFVYEALPEERDREEKMRREPSQLSLVELTQEYGKTHDEKEKKEPIILDYLSFSHLQSFDICPLHFRARYLLNLPAPNSAPLSFGTSLHNALKEFYGYHMQDKKQSLEDFLEILRKNWVSEGYSEKTHEKMMFEKGERIIKNYYKTLFDKKEKPVALELPFSFHLDPTLKIVGKIDRVDSLPDGKIEIIDYKTGPSNSISKSAYQLQLGMYALAATRIQNDVLHKNPEDITVTLLYLEDGEKISSQITEKDVENIDIKIHAKVKEIENSNFKCSKSILCRDCEYKMLCNVNN